VLQTKANSLEVTDLEWRLSTHCRAGDAEGQGRWAARELTGKTDLSPHLPFTLTWNVGTSPCSFYHPVPEAITGLFASCWSAGCSCSHPSH